MISVPIRYRRSERGQFAQKLQHAIPSVVVLTDGISHLSHDPHGVALVLGAVEVGAALAVIVSVARGLRKLAKRTASADPHHAHHGVDWIDIFIGVMLGVEAYAKYHETHHLPRPTVLLSIAMITLGILHPRIAAWGIKQRRLVVTPEHISIPKRPFSRVTLPWADVKSIDVDTRYATVKAAGGRTHRFDLDDMVYAEAVRDALMKARTFLDDSRHAASASIESTPTTA
jgi:hypothetical protein